MNCSKNGRKVLSSKKDNVIFDTNVLIRAIADIPPHSTALEHLIKKCDTIVFSTQIMKEYSGKFHVTGMEKYILLRKLEDLKQQGKFDRCHEAQLKRARNKIKRKRLPLPKDRTDSKFIEVAIGANARYIVTNDRHLLRLSPYKCPSSQIEIIKPGEYS
jgi:putative PIN family toxin of toxin-antitoxin system